MMMNDTKSKVISNNKIAGVWKLSSACLLTGTEHIPVLGTHPSGILILTTGLNFSVIVHNPDIENFISGDRMSGTSEENRLATQNSLALYGTYRVDEQGEFLDQQILGSSFPNWNGLLRGTEVLRLRVEDNNMIENMDIPDAGMVEIIWQLIE